MNTYKCPHCKIEVLTHEHVCNNTRSIHGQTVATVTVYQPNAAKPNKQSTVEGYMKRFGSRAS